MNEPFLDIAAVVTYLQNGLVPNTVREVREIGAKSGADPSQRATVLPRIIVISEARDPREQSGLAKHIRIEERLLLIVQIGDAAFNDARAGSTMRDICAEVYDIMHDVEVVAEWQPARYRGGRLLSIDDTTYSWAERYLFARTCR